MKFEKLFVDTFLALRTKRNYFLNLIYLMIHSSLPDLPFGNHVEVIHNLDQRFLPDLGDEAAKV